MANAPLALIEILIAASGATESQFTAEHPHPLLLPEKVRSGLLRRLQEEGGTGTLGVGPRQQGKSEGLHSGQVLVVRKEPLKGRLDRFDKAGAFGTWINIGRQADSDVMVNDFSVSKDHVQIRRHGDGFQIQDLGSSNGTTLNEARLEPQVPTDLQSGDLLRLGRVEMVFLLGSDLYRLLQPSVSDIDLSMAQALTQD